MKVTHMNAALGRLGSELKVNEMMDGNFAAQAEGLHIGSMPEATGYGETRAQAIGDLANKLLQGGLPVTVESNAGHVTFSYPDVKEALTHPEVKAAVTPTSPSISRAGVEKALALLGTELELRQTPEGVFADAKKTTYEYPGAGSVAPWGNVYVSGEGFTEQQALEQLMKSLSLATEKGLRVYGQSVKDPVLAKALVAAYEA
jgi:hypothetical protein